MKLIRTHTQNIRLLTPSLLALSLFSTHSVSALECLVTGGGTGGASSQISAIGCGLSASAGGINSTALGNIADSVGTSSIALGHEASSLGEYSTALGNLADSEGDYSTALGYGASATANDATAVGKSASAGPNSVAIGSGATTADFVGKSVAIGSGASTSSNSVALGFEAEATAFFGGVAVGKQSKALSSNSIALGQNTIIDVASENAVTLGFRAEAIAAPYGIAIGGGDANFDGIGTQVLAEGAIAIGTDVINDIAHSMKINVPLRIQNDQGTANLLIEEASPMTAVRNVVKLRNNGGVGFQLEDSSNTNKWEFRTGGSGAFLISDVNVGGAKMLMNSTGLVKMGKNVAAASNAWNLELDADGDLHIAGNMFVSGTQLSVPDYVFADDYKLMPLDELQNFVQKEKHLPNIASEAEVKKAKTVNVGKSQMRHLEKIEELTLYTIQQHQQIKGQLQQIEALRKSVAENTKMKERLASLEKLVTNLASSNEHLSLSGEKVATAK